MGNEATRRGESRCCWDAYATGDVWVTRKDRIRNKGIRGNLQVAPIKKNEVF